MIAQAVRTFADAMLRYWRASSRLQQVMFVAGSALLVSMLVHGVALAVTRGPITGPVSFRKAMTFAETGWLMCWAVGWLLPLITFRGREALWVAGSVLLFGLGETFVMSLQVWRGVPSHYNMTSTANAALFGAGGVMALIFVIGMIILLRASLRERNLAPSLLLSIRTGTVITLIGAITGWLMIANAGGVWQDIGRMGTPFQFDIHSTEPTVGGDLVALHAIGVHGLSLVPLAAWLLTYSRLAERIRYRLTAAVAGAIFALMLALAFQIFRALPFTAIDLVGGTLLLTATLLVLGSYGAVGWWTLSGLLWPAPDGLPEQS